MQTSTGNLRGWGISPLSFTLYVGDMATVSPNMQMLKYADDTIVPECLHESENSELQSELDAVIQWCDNNHLTINAS